VICHSANHWVGLAVLFLAWNFPVLHVQQNMDYNHSWRKHGAKGNTRCILAVTPTSHNNSATVSSLMILWHWYSVQHFVQNSLKAIFSVHTCTFMLSWQQDSILSNGKQVCLVPSYLNSLLQIFSNGKQVCLIPSYLNSLLQIGFGRRDNIGFSATCFWWQVSTLVGNVRCWVL